MGVFRREWLHLAFPVQDDVQSPSRGNPGGIVLLHNFVLKADGLSAKFLNAGANDQDVVIAGGPVVAALSLSYGQMCLIFAFKIPVNEAALSTEFPATDFKPDR